MDMKEYNDLIAECESLKSENTRLKNELTNTIKERNSYKSMCKELDEEINSLKDKISWMQFVSDKYYDKNLSDMQ